MKKTLLALATTLCFSQWASASCPLPNTALAGTTAATSLTLEQHVACLASSNPSIRDDIAFKTLSTSLRSGELSTDQVTMVHNLLINDLNKQDKTTHHHSFVVLSLAEVARVDRLTPFLSEDKRLKLVKTAIDSLVYVNDYSGFDHDIGYIHQIAHASDLVLQLALNDAIDKASLESLSLALQKAINPSTLHFYRYGEPDRLVRATVYLMLRESLDLDYWTKWLENAALPPQKTWQDAYSNNKGLAALHNTQSFFGRLLLWTADSKNPKLKAINEQALLHLKVIR
ncbi:DUF2785 domain-containing protein [Alteromonas gracilis]|uniref:DUF2785 domain-containing protein n=1 Tax=Alteromonas gracilis TaxID=1479524 RepID=UPI0030CC3271